LEWLPLVAQGARIVRLGEFYQRTSSLLGYDNSFSAKSGLGDFYQETDDMFPEKREEDE
jgi:hypothetical protein